MKVRILKSVLGAACEELRVWGKVPFGKLSRRDVEDGLALPNPEDSDERVTHLRSLWRREGRGCRVTQGADVRNDGIPRQELPRGSKERAFDKTHDRRVLHRHVGDVSHSLGASCGSREP